MPSWGKEGKKYKSDKLERENRKAQIELAKKQYLLVGEHYCPDWDEMYLTKGSMEFCVCTCEPIRKTLSHKTWCHDKYCDGNCREG